MNGFFLIHVICSGSLGFNKTITGQTATATATATSRGGMTLVNSVTCQEQAQNRDGGGGGGCSPHILLCVMY